MTERGSIISVGRRVVRGLSNGVINYGPQTGRVAGGVEFIFGLTIRSPVEIGIGAGLVTVSTGAAILRNRVRSRKAENLSP